MLDWRSVLNIGITGGTGFIGRHLIAALKKRADCSITVLHRRTSNPAQLQALAEQYAIAVRPYSGLESPEELKECLTGMDVVLHLAGLVSFRQRDRKKLRTINGKGMHNVLRACEAAGVKKMIHVSSTAALGFGNGVIDERTSPQWDSYPRCVYSASKALAEQATASGACDLVIAYPSLVLGPGDATNTLRLFRAIKQQSIPFNPPGSNSVIDVRDLASALSMLVDTPLPGQKIILATHHCTLAELHGRIASLLGVRPPRFTMPGVFGVPLGWLALLHESLSSDPQIFYENIFMAFQQRTHDVSLMKQIGFSPLYTLDATLRDAAEDFFRHQLL